RSRRHTTCPAPSISQAENRHFARSTPRDIVLMETSSSADGYDHHGPRGRMTRKSLFTHVTSPIKSRPQNGQNMAENALSPLSSHVPDKRSHSFQVTSPIKSQSHFRGLPLPLLSTPSRRFHAALAARQ